MIDPLLQLVAALDGEARRVRERFEAQVVEVELRAGATLARGRFALRGTSVYPDATGSPRLTYGALRGLERGPDGEAPQPAATTLRGLFEKATGQEPFALPPRWLASKARLALDTPLNFISTLDVTGGNSGSSVWSGDGQVVGLVFDGNLASLGGAFWYDEAVNRTVAVHPAGMLEALRRVYQAEALLQELAPGTPPRPTAPPGR